MKNIINSRHKAEIPNYSFILDKHLLICMIVIVTFLFGCTIETTSIPRKAVNNVKSVNTLKENKILAGRFICYVGGELVESKTFRLILRNEEGKRRVFKPDNKGYVAVPVPHGKYHIEIQLNSRIRLISDAPINMYDTDWVVNFGTIKLEFKESALSLLSKVTPTGIIINSIQEVKYTEGSLLVTQTQDWDTTRDYISRQISVSPQLIRNERIPDLLTGLKL